MPPPRPRQGVETGRGPENREPSSSPDKTFLSYTKLRATPCALRGGSKGAGRGGASPESGQKKETPLLPVTCHDDRLASRGFAGSAFDWPDGLTQPRHRIRPRHNSDTAKIPTQLDTGFCTASCPQMQKIACNHKGTAVASLAGLYRERQICIMMKTV
jgi:hypothetical protein